MNKKKILFFALKAFAGAGMTSWQSECHKIYKSNGHQLARQPH
jgi:hypothetical protein